MVHLNHEYKIQRKTIYRQGSVLVTIVIGFYQYLTPYDVWQATINLVKAVQEQPPSSMSVILYHEKSMVRNQISIKYTTRKKFIILHEYIFRWANHNNYSPNR
jgi:hypothetical protein